jgi:hypothetical protein
MNLQISIGVKLVARIILEKSFDGNSSDLHHRFAI